MNLWELQKNRPIITSRSLKPTEIKETNSKSYFAGKEVENGTAEPCSVNKSNSSHLNSTSLCRSAHPSVTSLTTSLTQFRTRFLLLINEFYLYSATTTYLKIVIRCPMRWSLCSGLVWSELVYSTILPWMIERGEPSSSIVRPYKTHRMNSPVVSSHVSSWWYLFSWSARDWSNYVQ